MIFFIDGKETFSSLLQDPITGHYFPHNFGPDSQYSTAPIIMALNAGSWGNWDTAEMLIDYFRYYTPEFSFLTGAYQNLNGYFPENWTADNDDGQTFSGGVPVTLETLYNNKIPIFDTPASNNNPVKIVNNSDSISSTIAQNNIAFTNAPGYQELYYQGTDGRLYKANKLDGQWHEYPLMPNVADVNGGISVSEPRVYYQSSNRNEIRYFQWIPNRNQWINLGTGAYCAPIVAGQNIVKLTVDQLGRVWYIDTNQNISVWYPAGPINGNIQQVTADSQALYGLTVWPCGCIVFYADMLGYVTQHSFLNSWNNLGRISSKVFSSPVMVPDVANGKLYFIGADSTYSDVDIYDYTLQYSQVNSTQLQKLGSTCQAYDNANAWIGGISGMTSVLALNPNGDKVYYLASDHNIWYYYNDYDWGYDSTNHNLIHPNWYRSPINNAYAGIFTVEPTTDQLFYADEFGTLNTIDWAKADNPILWTQGHGDTNNTDYFRSLEVSGLPVTDSGGTGLSITTYPNPSSGQFIFKINAANLDASTSINLRFYDIEGQPIDVMKSTLQPGVTQTLTWNAGSIGPGIYYYSAQISGQGVITGKLIKL